MKSSVPSRHGYVGESRFLGLAYVVPWLVGFLVFTAIPMLATLVLSFTQYSLTKAPSFAGLSNFSRMLSDPQLHTALRVTGLYVILVVPLKLTVSLLVALLLRRNTRTNRLARTAFYLPSILGSSIAVAILWRYLFSTGGLVNQALSALHLETVSWFGEPAPAMTTILLLRIWQFGSAMIVFLVARQDIPQVLYDAAELDGASAWCQFRSITLPLLRPVIFFNFVMQLIEAFQEFNAPYLITGGAPLHRTYLISMYLYDETFTYYEVGYACAVSWLLFALLSVFLWLAFRATLKKRRQDMADRSGV